MASIPYSILLSPKPNVLPISTIQEHQKFCIKFLKAHQNFEKYKNNSNSKLAFIYDNVFLFNQKKQSQNEILTWFNSLSEEEKLSLFAIKNKWLVNIFTQLFFIYFKMGNYSYKPLSDMCFCFEDQKKYLSRDQKTDSFNSLFKLLESKNISFKEGIKEAKSKNNKNDEKEYEYDDMNLYSSFFESKEIIDKDYLKSEKREYENKLIENIRVISSEKDNFDIITFKKEFIMNIDSIKKFFDYFSGENYFKDWVIPINAKNVYNFVLPYWMHNIQELSLCQLIMGYFEQKIMINYEYYYYTKKIYEFSYYRQISELYKENEKIEIFIKNNYSFNNNNKNKEEILSLKKISNVVDDLRGDEKFNNKIKLKKDIFNKICEEKPCYRGKEILFNDELSLEVYNSLNGELLKEKVNYIPKLIELISFITFFDIINLKENIFFNFRQKIFDSQCDLVLDELQSEGFLNKKGKKHKKKKKKNNDEEKQKKANPPPVKINIYDVQTKEIECEYNMNSRSQQFNMIQENASNVIINSYNNNNNIFIRGNKKSEDKKPKKVEISKKEDEIKKNLEKKDEKKEIEKIEIKKEIEKIETKKEEEKKEIKEEEDEKDEKEKAKDKSKKGFFLYPVNKKKKKEKENNINNNINTINEIKEKPKNNKHKKGKMSIKEDVKEVGDKNKKNYKMLNFVQERKNNVQINPCPRRKKKVFFQTSSINYEFHMKPSFDSYPYYYSFPMMKPFTSLSEVRTKFSMPSTIKNNNNENIKSIKKKNSISDKSEKSHWDYTQYNNNYNNGLQLFNSFIPSEKYFDSLNKELNNYLNTTNLNISNLKNIYEQNLEKIELLIKNGLSENYEIKFGHYGSFFSNLSIEGSDLDILIYYHKKKEESDFYKDILNLLDQNGNEFENICPILTASVPVIKLQIDIEKEIKEKNINLKNNSYFEEEDLSKIRIDLTFTESEEEFQHSHEVVTYISKSLEEYPLIKPILLLLKRYFKEMNMNKSYTGGLCSYSLFLLVLSFCKNNKKCESAPKLLYYFMENFTYFDYSNYCIDVEKENCYILKDKNDNEISISEGNSSYDTNYEQYDKEIFIVDPISKLNVSKSSFKVDEIILTFRKAFNLLYYEGWCYDSSSSNKDNENKIIDNENELYEDDSADFKTIKKLFGLKSLRNNFDFYFN